MENKRRMILFRGKRVDNGEWVEGYYYKTREGNTRIHSPHTVFKQHFTVLLETVGQYTGLEDKNGKKIFEGDLLAVPDDEIDKAVIEFGNGSFRVSLYGIMGAMMESGWDETAGGYGIVESEPIEFYGTRGVEVIGNIHDNKNLIE